MLDRQETSRKLQEYEERAAEFCQADLCERAQAAVDAAVRQFQDWADRINHGLDTSQREFQDLGERASSLKESIDRLDEELGRLSATPGAESSMAEYNRLIAERNRLVAEYNRLADVHREKSDLYDEEVRTLRAEREQRQTRIETIRRSEEEKLRKFSSWLRQDGPAQLHKEVTSLYATLLHAAGSEKDSPELQAQIDTARRIRTDLGAKASSKEDKAADEPLVVQVGVGRGDCLEQTYMIVDNGASVTSITPEMVEVLALQKQVGEEIELILAHNIRIRAPRLLIPEIAVGDRKTDYVKAVMLDASVPGVDGCLGLSFLNRFKYRIDNAGLTLEPMVAATRQDRFDVFLSHKSADLEPARALFDHLVEAGYRPFLSELSVATRHTTDFQKTIDAALEEADHLVVIASSREHLESPWVEAEWRLFEALKRSGRKKGNIVPVLCGGMRPEELPLALQRYNIISLDQPSWKEVLTKYLPR